MKRIISTVTASILLHTYVGISMLVSVVANKKNKKKIRTIKQSAPKYNEYHPAQPAVE